MIVISNNNNLHSEVEKNIEKSLHNLLIGYLNLAHKNGLTTLESIKEEYATLYGLIHNGNYNPSYIVSEIEYLEAFAQERRIRVAITIAARRIETLEKILRRKIVKNKEIKQYFRDLAEEKFGCFTFDNK